MKILLFGGTGQVGWELQRALAPLGDVVAPNRSVCDVADADAVRRAIRDTAPQAVINAAACTTVDRAESEPALAHQINALAPAAMAEECASLGAWLVHYSTDYVFDGSGTCPWREDDATGPLNVYGRTKLEGEQAVHRVGGRHLIFRTSWVYAARGQNFPLSILRLAADRPVLRVVADQFGAPTGADLIADVTAHALRAVLATPQLAGLYHLAPSGETHWCDYARLVLDCARRQGRSLQSGPDQVEGIPTTAYPTAARRPLNSRLDTARLRQTFNLYLPPWEYGVERMLKELS
ncbi:MAG: dTDP-4-dehydrorhamnose reductase [Immundisolibacter sp.]|uniref:dTDP-4-dehydrorhamnose reductase n=1 Tax=Immundisolibacter sp. TaxID=1934948 RepID=UPI003EDF5A27